MCDPAQMDARGSAPTPSADDLLTLLAVSRSGRFLTAAHELGVTHTTVARRIQSLERALGGHVLVRGSAGWRLTALGERAAEAAAGVEAAVSGFASGRDRSLSGVIRMSATDGFSGFVAAPAMAELRREHPGASLELVAVTRQASPQRIGVDLEVVVGRPAIGRAEAVHVADYALRMYASPSLLAERGTPSSIDDLEGAPFVYFIDSMLQVDVLDGARREVPGVVDAVTSTNVFVHVEATRAGAGFGLLPAFLADRDPGLVRVLPELERRLPYWLVARREAFDRPLIAAFVEALHTRIETVRPELLGHNGN
jgi:DNA-binding transcriptional LysR family regulator